MFRAPIEHALKIHPEPFLSVCKYQKTAELRIDDGHNFKVGDILLLKEWNPRKRQYSGASTKRQITHIIQVGKWIEGASPWVVLSMKGIH